MKLVFKLVFCQKLSTNYETTNRDTMKWRESMLTATQNIIKFKGIVGPGNVAKFLKWAIPGFLFDFFSSFQTNIAIFYNKYML